MAGCACSAYMGVCGVALAVGAGQCQHFRMDIVHIHEDASEAEYTACKQHCAHFPAVVFSLGGLSNLVWL